MQVLSETLDVSITEVIKGERSTPQNSEKQADSAVVEVLAYFKQMGQKTVGILLLIVGSFMTVFPFLFSGMRAVTPVSVWGVAVTAAGIAVFCRGRAGAIGLSKGKAGILSLAALAATLMLEALPFGAVLIFADGPDQRIMKTFSYFSLKPLGYGNFFPLLAAVLTGLIGVLSILLRLKRQEREKLRNTVFICTVIAFVCSAVPAALFGMEYMSVTGAGISVFLLLSAVLQAFANSDS